MMRGQPGFSDIDECHARLSEARDRAFLADRTNDLVDLEKAISVDVKKRGRTTAEAGGRDITIVIDQELGSSGKALTEHNRRDVLPDFRAKGS